MLDAGGKEGSGGCGGDAGASECWMLVGRKAAIDAVVMQMLSIFSVRCTTSWRGFDRCQIAASPSKPLRC